MVVFNSMVHVVEMNSSLLRVSMYKDGTNNEIKNDSRLG